MIYLVRESNTNYVKIGYTDTDLKNRLKSLQIGNPCKLRIVTIVPGDRRDEAYFHRLFKYQKMCGEWFRLSNEDIFRVKLYCCKKPIGPVDKEKINYHYCTPRLDVIVWFNNIMQSE